MPMTGNGKGEAPQPAALDDNQERWHYFFAHIALRRFVTHVPELLEAALADPQRLGGWIAAALSEAEKFWGLTPEQTLAVGRTIGVGEREIGDRRAVIVEMPPPREPTECYFVAIFRETDDSIGYYTLERSVFTPTVLCGWDKEGRHCNYGLSPQPTIGAFVRAIEELRAERASPPESEPGVLSEENPLDRLLASRKPG
jgi:hypothetical protein